MGSDKEKWASIGFLIMTYVAWSCEMATVGETVQVVHGNRILHYLCNCSVSLQLFWNFKTVFKLEKLLSSIGLMEWYLLPFPK